LEVDNNLEENTEALDQNYTCCPNSKGKVPIPNPKPPLDFTH